MRPSAYLLPSILSGLAMIAFSSLVSAESAQALPGRRIADATLAKQRGGSDTASGMVSGNQAVNVTTGSNSISAGALAGASGVPVVIQNSGNNVLIQSSVTVNVQLK